VIYHLCRHRRRKIYIEPTA